MPSGMWVLCWCMCPVLSHTQTHTHTDTNTCGRVRMQHTIGTAAACNSPCGIVAGNGGTGRRC